MNRREIEKLLGGYAAGILTEEERQALFAAALEDQSLFDALAREEPLRELLADPAARAHVLAALGQERPSLAVRVAAWISRPRVVAFGVTAAAVMVAMVVFTPRVTAPGEEKPVEVAELRLPGQPPPAPPPVLAEAPKPAPKLAARRPAPVRVEETPAPAAAEAAAVADAAPPLPAPAEPGRQTLTTSRAARTEYVQVAGAGQPALAWVALDPPHVGKPIRIRFQSRESGWLYVLAAEDGGWRVAATEKIEAGRPSMVSLLFEELGRKQMLALVSPTEQTDFRQGEPAVPPPSAQSVWFALEVVRP